MCKHAAVQCIDSLLAYDYEGHIIVIIMPMTMFIVLSSWLGHCK